jgi:hypothetical protein
MSFERGHTDDNEVGISKMQEEQLVVELRKAAHNRPRGGKRAEAKNPQRPIRHRRESHSSEAAVPCYGLDVELSKSAIAAKSLIPTSFKIPNMFSEPGQSQ